MAKLLGYYDIPDDLLAFVDSRHVHGGAPGAAPRAGQAPGQRAAPSPPFPKVPPGAVTPDDMAALEAAIAGERESADRNALAQNLFNVGEVFQGRQPRAPVAPVPTDMRDFLLRRQLAAEGQAAEAARAPAPPEWGAPATLTRPEAVAQGWAKKMEHKGAKPDDEPAPPEWGAPAGYTKGQAIRAGYGKAPKDEKENKPPTKEQIARGIALGIHPAEDENSIHFEAAIRAAENAKRAAEAKGANREDKKTASGWLGPDFEFGPNVPPLSVPDATRAKLMDEAGLVNHISDSAQRLRDLVKKYGPSVMGQAATEMSTLVEDLRLTVKDPVYNLGVLNGRDYELVSKVVTDPTNLAAIAKDKAGIRAIDKALETAQRQWRSKIKERMRGYGAIPTKGSRYADLGSPSPGAAAGAPADPLGIR